MDTAITIVILAFVLPWSIWRQTHARPVTGEGLVKLPLIFAVVAAVCVLTSPAPGTGAEVVAYGALSAVLAIAFGAWRGRRISIWRDGGTLMQRGNRATVLSWVALISLKFVLGTVASVTGWIPTEGPGAILGFLALTLAIQSLVVARRTVWASPAPVGTAA